MFVSKRTIVTLLLAVLTCSFLMAASTSTYNVTIESRIADGSGIEDGGEFVEEVRLFHRIDPFKVWRGSQ